MKRNNIYFFLSICLSVTSTVLWVNYGIILGNFIDDISKLSLNSLWIYSIKLIIYVIIVRGLELLSSIFSSIYSNKYILETKNSYIKHILRLKSLNSKGEVLNRFNTELSQIKRDYLTNTIVTVSSIISFVLSSVYLFKINITITSILYLLVFALFVFPYLCKRIIEKKNKAVIELERSQMNEIQDCLNGFESIRNYEVSDYFIENISNLIESHTKKSIIFEILMSTIGEISHCLITLVGGLGFFMGGYYVFLGKITYGNMIAIVQLTNTMVSPINNIINLIPKMIAGKKILEGIKNDICNTQDEVDLTEKNTDYRVKSIKFENVCYELNGQNILSHFTYEFVNKKRYLIVGESGSGKTTLLNILTKRIENYNGSILINNVDLKDISNKDLSNMISYMNQTPYIFNMSIKENILFEENGFVTDLLTKVKINKNENEMAQNMSGGERERVALCRILYDPHSVCLYDEVTASLDPDNASIIENIIFSMDNDITIYVAHHMTDKLLGYFDEIIDLNEFVSY